MRLANVLKFLEATYTKEYGDINNKTLTYKELTELDSEIVSVENLCKQFRSIIQNKIAQKTYPTIDKGDSNVPSIQLQAKLK